MKCRNAAIDTENEIWNAKHGFRTGLELFICAAASTYDIPYGILQDQLGGAQLRVQHMRRSSCWLHEEEKSIVRCCETLDDLGHPLQGKMVQTFAMSRLPSHQRLQLGNLWMTHFLNRHPAVTTKFSQHLDTQRADGNDPAILKDFFSQGISI